MLKDRAEPRLLSGGNPQISKGYGEGPVQAWIAAAPGWKSEAGARLDALVTRTVPGVKKAVKWNSPLYGAEEGDVWFLSFHAMTHYLKVAFHNGVELDPPLPVGSKQPRVRYLHIGEDFDWSDPQLAPAITETVKWRKPTNPDGVPVWERGGILLTGETYKTYVKLTFMRGAALPDPARLFNASLEAGTRRAIDIRQGDVVNGAAFMALVQAAVAENLKGA